MVSPLFALAAPLLVSLAVAACAKARDASDEGRDAFAGETRDTAIKHEPCDGKGKTDKTLKATDPLAKSAPYVTHVIDGGREVCSFADINGDGRIDLWTYFDETGATRRTEAAYGVNPNVTEIGSYKSGELEMVARDTTGSERLDTWDHYANGKLVARERDKNGDGRLDEWWTFDAGSDVATITEADPRTGKADPASAIKVEVGFQATAPTSSAAPRPKVASAPASPTAPSSSASAASSQVTP